MDKIRKVLDLHEKRVAQLRDDLHHESLELNEKITMKFKNAQKLIDELLTKTEKERLEDTTNRDEIISGINEKYDKKFKEFDDEIMKTQENCLRNRLLAQKAGQSSKMSAAKSGKRNSNYGSVLKSGIAPSFTGVPISQIAGRTSISMSLSK